MSRAIAIVLMTLILPNTTGCGYIILNNALERHADRKEVQERNRHQERMRELELQEKLMNKQYPQQGGDAGAIVRDNPF